MTRLGDYIAAKGLLDDAAGISQAESDQELLAEVTLSRMTLLFYLADYDAMEECGRAALAIAEKHSLAWIEAGACSGLGKSAMVKRRFEEGIRWYERARVLFAAEGLSAEALRMQTDAGCCYLGLGELDKAMEIFSEALRSSEATGALPALHIDHANVGCVHLKRGEYELALCHFQKALEIARDLQDQISVGKWLHNLALTHKCMGDRIQAITYEFEAERVNRRVAEARAAL